MAGSEDLSVKARGLASPMWREDREEGKKTLSELENKNADVVLFQKHILLIKSMEN